MAQVQERPLVRSLLLSSSFLVVPFLVWPGIDNYSIVKWLGVALLSLTLAMQGRFRIHHSGLALLLFAGLSLLWSPDYKAGALAWLNAATLYVVFLVVWNSAVKIPWGLMALMGVMAGVTFPMTHGGYGNENFLSHFLILTIPFCLTKTWWPVALLTLSFILLNGSSEILIVLGVAYVYGLWLVLRRMGAYWAILGVLIPINVWMYVQPDLDGLLWAMWNRAELWTNSLAVFVHHPFGTGLGGFNYYYPQFDEYHLRFFENNLLSELKLFAGAAHNEWLQLLVVLGPIGLMGGVWFAYSLWPTEWRLRAAFVIAIIIGLVNFPYQLPGSALLIACILGLSARSRLPVSTSAQHF